MVDNTTAELQWIGGGFIALATLVAVTFGGGMTRKVCSWFYRLKLKWCLPLMLVGWVIAAVFTVSAVGFFLFWRNRSAYNTQYYDSVMGLHFGSLLAIYFFGNMLFNWKKFGCMTLCILLAFAGTTVALILMGIQKAWLPFGLYFALPVFLLYVLCMSIFVWRLNMNSSHIKKKKVEEIVVTSAVADGEHYSHSTHHRSHASISDMEGDVGTW